MKANRKILTAAVLIGSVAVAAANLPRLPSSAQPSPSASPDVRTMSSRPTCTPTFADGGGPYYQPETPFRTDLTPENHAGETLTVTGKVLESDCITPLPGVIVDIWQANESGNYEDDWYRGRVETDTSGTYVFTTVVPKGYGAGSGFRPPHIHFKIWQGGQLLITSQMFLPESRSQGIEDVYIMKVESETQEGKVTHRGYHDIILP